MKRVLFVFVVAVIALLTTLLGISSVDAGSKSSKKGPFIEIQIVGEIIAQNNADGIEMPAVEVNGEIWFLQYKSERKGSMVLGHVGSTAVFVGKPDISYNESTGLQRVLLVDRCGSGIGSSDEPSINILIVGKLITDQTKTENGVSVPAVSVNGDVWELTFVDEVKKEQASNAQNGSIVTITGNPQVSLANGLIQTIVVDEFFNLRGPNPAKQRNPDDFERPNN